MSSYKRMLYLVFIWLAAAFQYASAATPFTAPASFDLRGSEIGFELTLNGPNNDISSSVDPNPTPITGQIRIDTLNQASGVFSGGMSNISATSTLAAPPLGSPSVTLTLNSDELSGLFIWQQNKVFFNAETLVATMTIGDQRKTLPLSGIKLPASYSNGRLSLSFKVEETFEYSGASFDVVLDVHLVGNLLQSSSSTGAQAGSVWIQLNTDKMSYQSDDTLKLFGAVGNAGPGKKVDLYIALQMPDGSMLFYPHYTADALPVLSGFELGADAYIPPIMLHDMTLPSQTPPIATAQSYQFLAAVTETGTFNFLTDIVSAPFTFGLNNQTSSDPDSSIPNTGSGPYDGVWTGTGGSNVVSADCPGLANVTFDITNNLVTGVAVEAATNDADAYDVTAKVNGNTLADGVLWEAFQTDLIAVGAFSGTFSGSTLSGTWYDSYGCSGTYSMRHN